MNYAAVIYKMYLRELIKDVAREYPDNSEGSFEDEVKYLRKRLEDEKIGWLFDKYMNKETFYSIIHKDVFMEINPTVDPKKNEGLTGGVDLWDIRKKYERERKEKDIIWILQGSAAKLNGAKKDDRCSLDRFRSMLDGMDFSDEEKDIFQYYDGYFYFNALPDKNAIYEVKKGDNNFERRFKNAAGTSDLATMHDKLKKVLEIWKKIENGKKKLGFEDFLIISGCLWDLVPTIDKESNLKSEKQLFADQTMIRLAIFRYYIEVSKNRKYDLKNTQDLYLYLNLVEFFEEVRDKGNFNEEQIGIITDGYFEYLNQNLIRFKEKVAEYKSLCKGIRRNSKTAAYKYYEMWQKVYNNHPENE